MKKLLAERTDLCKQLASCRSDISKLESRLQVYTVHNNNGGVGVILLCTTAVYGVGGGGNFNVCICCHTAMN